MRSGLEGPDAVVGPTAQQHPGGSLQVLSRELVNVVDHQTVPDVIDRVASIQTRIRVTGCVALAGTRPVGCGGAAVPSRAVVDRVPVSVVHIEQQPARHLAFDRGLQRIVVGVDRILPSPQLEKVRVQAAVRVYHGVLHSRPRVAEIVRNLDACWQPGSGFAIDVLSAEELVTGCAHILHVDYRLRRDFTLDAEVEVVYVRIANALREDDSRQVRKVGISRIPAIDVALGLRLPGRALVGVARIPGICYGYVGNLSTVSGRCCQSANRRTINYISPLYANPAAEDLVEGVVREIPARVRKRVIERSLVGYAKAAAYRCFAIAKHIPGKADPRSKVVVVALPQVLGWSEATRPTARTHERNQR